MENNWDQAPGITVITPTHGRVDLVAQLLISLHAARQAYSGPAEVLIVDSSPANESEKIQRACSEHDAICHCMPNNVRQKRNWGIQNAKYPIILFIDSDCVADVNLLVEHARLYSSNTIPDLGGVVGLTRFVGKENWVWQIIRRSSTLDAFSYPERYQVVPWGPTCNISYRRYVLEKVGLFDTTFPFILGGDDTDLGLRVTDSGYRIMTSAHAIVEHEKRTWTRIYDIAQRRYRWGRMHYYLMRTNDLGYFPDDAHPVCAHCTCLRVHSMGDLAISVVRVGNHSRGHSNQPRTRSPARGIFIYGRHMRVDDPISSRYSG